MESVNVKKSGILCFSADFSMTNPDVTGFLWENFLPKARRYAANGWFGGRCSWECYCYDDGRCGRGAGDT